MSLRLASTSMRAMIAPASSPGGASTGLTRTSFSALACSRPRKEFSLGAAPDTCCRAGASAVSSRARTATFGTPSATNGSSGANVLSSIPSDFTAASSAG